MELEDMKRLYHPAYEAFRDAETMENLTDALEALIDGLNGGMPYHYATKAVIFGMQDNKHIPKIEDKG